MAGASIRIDQTFDDRQVLEALQTLRDAGGDMQTLFADIGKYLDLAHRDRFSAQQDPDGNPWQPLAPKTQARKKKNRDLILVLNGYLRATLAYNADQDGLEFGSNRDYAATHQFGAPARGIPARPFLGISASDESEILDILQGWLEAAIR